MDRAQMLGLGAFVLAWVVLFLGAILSLWEFTTSTFLLLLLLSGLAYGADYLSKKLGLRTIGRLVIAAVIGGVLLFFFAPAVQTLPNGQGTGTVCGSTGCSSVYQYDSVTAYLWCYGATYDYAPPPATEFGFTIEAGCLPPM